MKNMTSKIICSIVLIVTVLACSFSSFAQFTQTPQELDSIELATQALARGDRTEMNRILQPLRDSGVLNTIGVTGTPEKQDRVLRAYADMMGNFAAQAALASGDRDKMVRILKPMALRGNESSIKTLKIIGITDFAPSPKPMPKKVTPTIPDAVKAKADLELCLTNPQDNKVDANISACERSHSYYRLSGNGEYTKIRTIAVDKRTDANYKLHDDYFYKSGLASFQLARLHNVKSPENHAILCPHLHKAAKQFSNIHTSIPRGSEPWKTIAKTQHLLSTCKAKGL